ncbi:hypothetical protein AVEN_35159-1 [Araneus ventricosus]|uniref:Uncharacterized protein n=1 Tax=Araneus ventricosus TaxID=182803 RepID=A0A4Y2HC30_ARAVE|nr:hypothetical protein AVEN_35159-1 [Araneus ventricosus]
MPFIYNKLKLTFTCSLETHANFRNPNNWIRCRLKVEVRGERAGVSRYEQASKNAQSAGKRPNTVYSLLSVRELSGLRIIRAHSGLTKKFKEKHFHAYHACKIDVDVRSRDSFLEISEP